MRNVTAGYAADIDVLRNVSLTVEEGQIAGLIGLNGAGKSTLMKTICGFLAPKRGSVLFSGREITGVPPYRLIDIGIWYIPQESSLFPFMTVGDNLRLPLERLVRGTGRPDARGAEARFKDMLEKFPALGERLDAQAGDLSGGQQKMLEFAKAWLVRPTLCLVDEPSIGLSPKVAEDVYRWIDMFSEQGMAILLVDHNVRRVVKMSDHVYVLSLGEITAHGTPAEFGGDLHAQVKSWLGITF